MAKYLNRIDKVLSECKDIDREVKTAETRKDATDALEVGNHFMLREIAINTAVLVDMIDRLVTDFEPINVSDTDIADALIDAYMRKKGRSNDT